jgi:hypothetical protein
LTWRPVGMAALRSSIIMLGGRYGGFRKHLILTSLWKTYLPVPYSTKRGERGREEDREDE